MEKCKLILTWRDRSTEPITFQANNQSGYIGVAIVGGFLMIVLIWYGGRWIRSKAREGKVQGQDV